MEYYITAEHLEQLKKELEELKTKTRLEVADRLKRAKELGDLSENSEYFEAREEYGQIETRILELENMIKNAKIITKSEKTNQVQIGSTVELEKEGKPMTFTIVGSDEAQPEAGFISNESPIGKATLGKKVGDIVKIRVPVGETAYKIVKIK